MKIHHGILVGYLLSALALTWGFFPFTVDDTFISLRFSENLANGLGPVFNAGERVEGYSNPLWVAVFGLLAFLPGDMFILSKIISSGFYVAGGFVLLLRILRDGGHAWLAALLYLATFPLALWGVSGMETSLFAFLLLLWAMTVTDANPSGIRVLSLAVLLLVARPESPLPLAIGFAALYWRGMLSLRVAGAFAAMALALLAIRYGYYGDVLPNTYYAKKYQTLGHLHMTLWYYIRPFYLGPGLIPLAGMLAFAWRFRGKADWALVALVLWPALFSLMVGGDWMPAWRFMIPSLPLAIWLLTRALAGRWDARIPISGPGPRRAIGSALAALLVSAHGALSYQAARRDQALDFSLPTTAKLHMAVSGGNPNYMEVVRWLGSMSPAPRSLVVGELGYFCYYVPVKCLDLHGLVDPYIAKSKSYPNTVIGKLLPIHEDGFRETDIGRYLIARDADVWILADMETGGLRDTLFQGALIRRATFGNFQIFR